MKYREMTADAVNLEIRAKLATLKKMQAVCAREKRLPDEVEVGRAEVLLKEIDDLEVRKKELEKTPPVEKPQGRPSHLPCALRTSEDRTFKAGQIRVGPEPKDYRSLFGSQRTVEWRDEQSNFFSALFSGRFHPELRAMSEGVPSDGGFLVPTEFAEKIHNVAVESEVVMPRATVAPMTSNSLLLPAVEIGDHSSNLYGGFTASYKPEAGTLTEANPKTRQMELQAKKLTGFVRFSNELMADAVRFEEQILQICGQGLGWYRDKAFLKGSGAGEPLGILNAGCTIVQDKETGQAADSIVYPNLAKMLSRLHAASFQNAVWVCHQSTIPELLQLSVAVGTGGSHVPVLQENGGRFTILTRPVVFTEKTAVLGDQGDILLADFSQYVIGLRQEMRMDLSQHVYFTTDEGAARLIERHDGQPLWGESLTLEDGSSTVSPFVVLQART